MPSKIGAVLAMDGRRIARVEVRFGDIDLGLVRDVANHACLRTGAEQCALRAFEHLDALYIGGVDIQVTARQLRGLLIEIDRGRSGKLPVAAGRLGDRPRWSQGRACRSGLTGAVGGCRHVWQKLHVVVKRRAFSCVNVSPVSAWIVIGTFCRFSVRRLA